MAQQYQQIQFGNRVTGPSAPPSDFRPGFQPEFQYFGYEIPKNPNVNASSAPMVPGAMGTPAGTAGNSAFGLGGGAAPSNPFQPPQQNPNPFKSNPYYGNTGEAMMYFAEERQKRNQQQALAKIWEQVLGTSQQQQPQATGGGFEPFKPF